MAQDNRGSGAGDGAAEEDFVLSRDTGATSPERERPGDGASQPETTPEGEASNPHAHLGSEAPADAKGPETPPTEAGGSSEGPDARAETGDNPDAATRSLDSGWTPPQVDGPAFDATPDAGPLDNPGRQAPPERTETTVFSSGSGEPGGLPESSVPPLDLPPAPANGDAGPEAAPGDREESVASGAAPGEGGVSSGAAPADPVAGGAPAPAPQGLPPADEFDEGAAVANRAPGAPRLVSGFGIETNQDGGNDAFFASETLADDLAGARALTFEMQFSSTTPPGANWSSAPTFMSYVTQEQPDALYLAAYDWAGETRLGLHAGGDWAEVGLGDVALFDGQVHAIAMTWDATDGAWSIYVDGQEIASGIGLGAGAALPGDGTFYVGVDGDAGTGTYEPWAASTFAGTIHEARIFDAVRDPADLAAEAFGTVEPGTAGLLADWRMADLEGGAVGDATGRHPLDLVQQSGAGWTAGTPRVVPGVYEGAAAGTLVATFAADDPDAGDTLTFELVGPDGQPLDHPLFELVGQELRVKDGAQVDHEAAASHDLTVRVSDAEGLSATTEVTVRVADLNEAPEAILLDGSSVAENAAGAVVGTLDVVDPDAGDTHGYVVSDDRFEVVDGQLKLKDGVALDHEAEPTVTVSVTAYDGPPAAGQSGLEPTGLATTQTFEIDVANVNEAPHDLALDTATLLSDAAAGTVVGTFSASDVDSDAFAYRLVDQDGTPLVGSQRLDAALAEDPGTPISVGFGGSGTQPHLTSMGRLYDNAGTDTHTVWRVRNPLDTELEVALDPNGPDDQALTLTLPPNSDTFVASAETGGAATHRLFHEGSQVAVKAAGSHAFSYGQQVETGGHPLFEIVGNKLVLKDGAGLDAAVDPTVWVEVTDEGGLSRIEPFTIDVQDPPVPVRFTFSNASRDEGLTQDRTDSYTVEAAAPGGRTIDGAEMDIRGVGDDDSVRVRMSDEGRATADLLSEWNSIKNVLAEAEGGADVRLNDFVDVEVNLGDGGDSRVDVNDAKRGRIATGDGDDRVDVRAQSNGAGWDNRFVVETGAGDDRVTIHGDRDLTSAEVDAGDGDDTVRFRGEGESTLRGGDGEDRLVGGAGRDRLHGDAGDDRLDGNAGRDQLFGGGGDDRAFGGADNDWLQLGDGDDTGRGGAGDDQLLGGAGADVLHGQDGNDTIDGDRLWGSRTAGVWSHERDFAEGGDDRLYGGAGNDLLRGGEGDDILRGGRDDDTLYGDTDVGSRDGGAETGTLVARGGGFRFTVAQDGAETYNERADGQGMQGGRLEAQMGDGVLSIRPDGAGTWLNVHGGEGIGVYTDGEQSNSGNKTLDGGEALILEIGPEAARSGASAAQVTVRALGEGESLRIEALLDGQTVGERVFAGSAARDDTFDFDPGEGVAFDSMRLSSVDGSSFYFREARLETTDIQPAGDDRLWGGAGDDVAYGGGGDDRLHGGDGDDALYGEAGADMLSGGAGDDRLDGGAGNDELRGQEGDDILVGGAGDDRLRGDAGADRLDGGAGDDDLRGGAGEDSVDGGAGDDRLYGNAGDDRMTGGAGSDILRGGDGNDALDAGDGGPSGSVSIGVANATATDQGFRVTGQRVVDGELTETSAEHLTFSDRWGIGVRGASGGADDQVGFDEESGLSERINVEFDGPVGEANVTVTRLFASEGEAGETGLWRAFLAGQEVGSGTFAAESGHQATIRIATEGGFDHLQFEGLPLDEPGADASEFYLQSVDATFLNDGGTANTLDGGSGNDILTGAGGDDTLSGGTGNDVMAGGAGNDVLDGGEGDDLFVFAAGGGSDSVSGGGGAWTDTILMQGTDGPPDGTAWTVQLDQGAAVADEAGLVLSEDAVGTITLADGSEISFEGIERIDW